MLDLNKIKLAVIGLGYVGLPLAIEFGKKYSTIGFDINSNRIDELKNGKDLNREYSSQKINSSSKLVFTSNLNDISSCNIFIISVPTPINKNKKPNLKLLFSASKNIAPLLKKNDIVIYESTVYPGCTESLFVKDSIFDPHVINGIRIKSQLGRYSLRGMSLAKRLNLKRRIKMKKNTIMLSLVVDLKITKYDFFVL